MTESKELNHSPRHSGDGDVVSLLEGGISTHPPSTDEESRHFLPSSKGEMENHAMVEKPLTLHLRFTKLPPPIAINPQTMTVVGFESNVSVPARSRTGSTLSIQTRTAMMTSRRIGASNTTSSSMPASASNRFESRNTSRLNRPSTTSAANTWGRTSVRGGLAASAPREGAAVPRVASLVSTSRPASQIPRVASIRNNSQPQTGRTGVATASQIAQRNRATRHEEMQKTVRETRIAAAEQRRRENALSLAASRERSALSRTGPLSSRSTTAPRIPLSSRPTTALSTARTTTSSLSSTRGNASSKINSASNKADSSRPFGTRPATALNKTAPLPRVALLSAKTNQASRPEVMAKAQSSLSRNRFR